MCNISEGFLPTSKVHFGFHMPLLGRCTSDEKSFERAVQVVWEQEMQSGPFRSNNEFGDASNMSCLKESGLITPVCFRNKEVMNPLVKSSCVRTVITQIRKFQRFREVKFAMCKLIKDV